MRTRKGLLPDLFKRGAGKDHHTVTLRRPDKDEPTDAEAVATQSGNREIRWDGPHGPTDAGVNASGLSGRNSRDSM